MDLKSFTQDHLIEITATAALVGYALIRKKLTPDGIAAAVFVAAIHMLHPWRAFFWLPIIFFLLGTTVTKIGHEAKAHLTQSSTGGSSSSEGTRNSTQVLANSGFACILVLLHLYLLSSTPFISTHLSISAGPYAPTLQRLLPIGILAHYAAVTADTFSSELGILATASPRLITAPWKSVPKGTNGGVTTDGLVYGALGSSMITSVSTLLLSATRPNASTSVYTSVFLIYMGVAGSIIDSVLGATVQATVTDRKSGKVVEGLGGQRVKVLEGGSRVQIGYDVLTNNGVNFAMAGVTSVVAMGLAYAIGLELSLK